MLGKPLPPLPEVSIPRFTGKAQYASRVWFPDLLYARFLTCPHPHAPHQGASIPSAAEKMPGVAYVLTYKNAPKSGGPAPTGFRAVPDPLPQELNLQGEVVAIVAAETEDLARGCRRRHQGRIRSPAVRVHAEGQPWRPARPILAQRQGQPAAHANSPKDFPNATWADQQGDIEKGFAEADVVKEFTYRFAGAVSVPMQPSGSVAKWDGDKLTFWGMGQGIYPVRAALAAALGIDAAKIRFINK